VKLSDLVTIPKIKLSAGERWAVVGPEAETFGARLGGIDICRTLEPEFDGLLLAGALSTTANNVENRLKQFITYIKPGGAIVVIDWQYDGPPDYGPNLDVRFKQGRLCRLLRETGFGLVERLENHDVYYVVRAVKGPLQPDPHAGEFVVVASLEELPKNRMKSVELYQHKIVVANTGKEIVAFAQACPHANSPLDRGILRGRNIACASHAYIWNVHTGEPVEPGDEDTLHRYPVKVDSARGQVLVAVAPQPTASKSKVD
jgi:nitrite reductase/ring-hydroxylating ferredoxin subunit